MTTSQASSCSLEEFFFKVSFTKFHVTCPDRAGTNKIYEFRRAKSFFFELADPHTNTNDIHLKIHTNDYHMKTSPISYKSTSRFPNTKYQISNMLRHFFSHQRVIPRRIQDKYFNFIRLKLLDRIDLIRSRGDQKIHRNITTKTFFNFSYKRYRFHFGIFLPCSHPYIHPNNSDVTIVCNIPCPSIMSFHRRACIDHHKQLEIFDNVKNIIKPDLLPISSSWKGQHATHLFNKSSMQESKQVFSLRQGIRYKVDYMNYNRRVIENSRIRNMYYTHRHSLRHDVRLTTPQPTKQHIRFDRNCRRAFNANKDHPAMAGDINDRLACANRNKFLFLTTQHINSRITHLKYKECNPKRDNYPYPIPIHSTKVVDKKNPTNAYFALVSNSRSKNPRHKPPSSTFYDAHSFSREQNELVSVYHKHVKFMSKMENHRLSLSRDRNTRLASTNSTNSDLIHPENVPMTFGSIDSDTDSTLSYESAISSFDIKMIDDTTASIATGNNSSSLPEDEEPPSHTNLLDTATIPTHSSGDSYTNLTPHLPVSGDSHTTSTLHLPVRYLPNLFDEVSSTSDDYETTDSGHKPTHNTEQTKTISPHIPITYLDLFNTENDSSPIIEDEDPASHTNLFNTAAVPTSLSCDSRTNSTPHLPIRRLPNLFDEVSSTSDEYETADSGSTLTHTTPQIKTISIIIPGLMQ